MEGPPSGSKSSSSPKARFRFGFSGHLTRKEEEAVSVDDILDSLSQRAQLSECLDETAGTVFEGKGEGSGVPLGVSDTITRQARKNGLGKFAFAFLLMTGVFVVWLYGALDAVLEGTTVGRLTQSPLYSSAFTDPVKLAILALGCLIPVMLVKRRRRARDTFGYG